MQAKQVRMVAPMNVRSKYGFLQGAQVVLTLQTGILQLLVYPRTGCYLVLVHFLN